MGNENRGGVPPDASSFRASGAGDLGTARKQIFHSGATGNANKDADVYLRGLGIKAAELPEPYKSALEMGDARIARKYLEAEFDQVKPKWEDRMEVPEGEEKEKMIDQYNFLNTALDR